MISGYQDYTLRFLALKPQVFVNCHYCPFDAGPYDSGDAALAAAEEHIEKHHGGIRDSRCVKCGGSGDLEVVDASRDEDATGVEECPDCHGSGFSDLGSDKQEAK